MPVFQVCGKGGMMAGNMVIPFLIIGADSFYDIRNREIYPLLTLTGIIFGILIRLTEKEISPAGLLLALLPGIIVWTGAMVTDGQIGRGDALAIFLIGAWTDMWKIWEVVLFASLGAAVFSIALWIKNHKNEEIPFVPFLFAAMVLGCFL